MPSLPDLLGFVEVLIPSLRMENRTVFERMNQQAITIVAPCFLMNALTMAQEVKAEDDDRDFRCGSKTLE